MAQWDSVTGYFGENLTIRHNYFYRLAYGAQLDYTYNVHIKDCRFEDITTAAIHNPSVFGEPDYDTIQDNVFINNAADINLPAVDYCVVERNNFLDVTAAIVFLTGAHNKIHQNVIEGNPAGANNMINLTGGATNIVSDNWLSCSIAQYDSTCSDATSGSWVRNHCIDGDTAANPT